MALIHVDVQQYSTNPIAAQHQTSTRSHGKPTFGRRCAQPTAAVAGHQRRWSAEVAHLQVVCADEGPDRVLLQARLQGILGSFARQCVFEDTRAKDASSQHPTHRNPHFRDARHAVAVSAGLRHDGEKCSQQTSAVRPA